MSAAPNAFDGLEAPLEVVITRLSDIEAKPVRSIWADRVFYGEPFVIAGPPGVGKSFILGAITAAVTRGNSLPGGGDICEPGDVIVLALEDDAGRVLRPRYEAMGADLDRVHVIQGVRHGEDGRVNPFCLDHIRQLEEALQTIPDATLITIDPIASMLAGADTFRSNDVRAILDPFLDATSSRGIAVGLATHTNKSLAQSGAFRVEGSLGGFVGRARSVLAVGLHSETGKHGVGLLKSNLGRLDVPVIGYEIDATGRFFWLGEDDTITAAELFSPPASESDRSGVEDARDAILTLLQGGQRSASELTKSLRSQGHSDRTVDRARARLRKDGEIVRSGGGVAGEVLWSLAASALTANAVYSPPVIRPGEECDSVAESGYLTACAFHRGAPSEPCSSCGLDLAEHSRPRTNRR